MDNAYLRCWWIFALRGLIAILFGVIALLSPGITLLGLIALFAWFALLGGAVSVFGAIRNRGNDEDWWMPLLFGLTSMGAGAVALLHPGLTALVLVLLIGANALATGVLDIAAAVRLRKSSRDAWLLGLSAIASVAFGVLVFLFPGAGALALIWMVSFYAILTGALLLGLAFRLRKPAKVGSAAHDRRVTPDRRAAHAH